MRLLNAKTLQFEVFYDNQMPSYLILSHTWGNEEINYQEMRFLQRMEAQKVDTFTKKFRSDRNLVAALAVAADLDLDITSWKSLKDRTGYKKIEMTAQLANEFGFEYFWIDTCCIDKSSSAELQEAINSMYYWYQISSACVVHLENAQQKPGEELGLKIALDRSRWITRGWTLQELIAPRASCVYFYDHYWRRLGSKSEYSQEISSSTGIPRYILTTGDLSVASVAQKMSWAATRTTTRTEDRAYSLMGLFNVHMPMLYGEGKHAFRRLQEEIMRTTADDSIFAWRADDGSLSKYCGLLAQSPFDFAQSSDIMIGRGTFSPLNLGIQMECRTQHLQKAQTLPWLDLYTRITADETQNWDHEIYACLLEARSSGIAKHWLYLRKLEKNKFARIMANAFAINLNLAEGSASGRARETLIIEHTPYIPKSFKSSLMHCFYLKQRDSGGTRSPLRTWIASVRPAQFWSYSEKQLRIPVESTPEGTYLELREHDFDIMNNRRHFIGMITIMRTSKEPGVTRRADVLIGYEMEKQRAWCMAVRPGDFDKTVPLISAPTEEWRAFLSPKGNFEDCKSEVVVTYDMLLSTHIGGVRHNTDERTTCHIEIVPGLHQGFISHIVYVEDLV